MYYDYESQYRDASTYVTQSQFQFQTGRSNYAAALAKLGGDVAALETAVEIAAFQALTLYGKTASTDARKLLNKPHWLLSRAIGYKVVKYPSGAVVALVGAKRTAPPGADPGEPDPGIYARYYQGGDRPGIVDHWLKRAKFKNLDNIPPIMAQFFERAIKDHQRGVDLSQKLKEINLQAQRG